jgi:hypothetical protein
MLGEARNFGGPKSSVYVKVLNQLLGTFKEGDSAANPVGAGSIPPVFADWQDVVDLSKDDPVRSPKMSAKVARM